MDSGQKKSKLGNTKGKKVKWYSAKYSNIQGVNAIVIEKKIPQDIKWYRHYTAYRLLTETIILS